MDRDAGPVVVQVGTVHFQGALITQGLQKDPALCDVANLGILYRDMFGPFMYRFPGCCEPGKADLGISQDPARDRTGDIVIVCVQMDRLETVADGAAFHVHVMVGTDPELAVIDLAVQEVDPAVAGIRSRGDPMVAVADLDIRAVDRDGSVRSCDQDITDIVGVGLTHLITAIECDGTGDRQGSMVHPEQRRTLITGTSTGVYQGAPVVPVARQGQVLRQDVPFFRAVPAAHQDDRITVSCLVQCTVLIVEETVIAFQVDHGCDAVSVLVEVIVCRAVIEVSATAHPAIRSGTAIVPGGGIASGIRCRST